MADVYFDTSFLTGYLESRHGRREEAKKILAYEAREESTLHTSVLTLNEFCCAYYDRYRGDEDCGEKIEQVVSELRSIATPTGFSDAVMKRSAFLMSTWGERHKHDPETAPDMKRCRWDAIHIATADVLGCVRAYAWDNGWSSYQQDVPKIRLISPAVCPQSTLDV